MDTSFGTIDNYVKHSELEGLTGTVVTVANLATGGSLGTAATTTDIASAINVNQTTASQTMTLANPTNTGLNYRFPVNNVGSTSFTLLSTVISPGAGIMVDWTGSAWSVIGTSSGATNVTVAGGKVFTVSNTLTLAGTDGTTMTFPSTSATIARTDAANTFTGVQTMTSPVFTTPTLGVAVATSLNGLIVTTTTGTFTLTAGKTLTVQKTLNFTGTDSTVMTFPSTSATIARTDAGQTFTGVQVMTSPTIAGHATIEGVTATGAVGTGNFVFDGTPTLTTPILGVATGTSLAVTGLLTTSSPTANFGYATGAGGAVTQATNKSTGVTLNTNTGAITLNNAALTTSTTVSFTLTNSTIGANDTIVLNIKSGATVASYHTQVESISAGSAVLSIRNYSLGTLSEAVVLQFTVIGGAIA